MRRKAFAMLDRLADCHWDNCKVVFANQTAFKFTLKALIDGHNCERIVSCYADALYVCHGFAVDQAANTGKITFFNCSSTVVKARERLSRDGLTRRERIARWYREKRADEACVERASLDPDELARMRTQIHASFPIEVLQGAIYRDSF